MDGIARETCQEASEALLRVLPNPVLCLQLQLNEVVGDFLGLQAFPDFDQALDDVADAALALAAVGDACVRHALGVDAEEVLILGEDDAPFGEGVGRLLLVGCRAEAGFGRGCTIDAATGNDRLRVTHLGAM